MYDAGCAQILIGLEDPSNGVNHIELRNDWKAKQVDHYLSSIRRIQDQGITVNGCFVLGLDNQTQDTFERLWNFIQKSELYEVQLTIMTPFPGTPLYKRLQEEGRLIMHKDGWRRHTLFDIVYQPKNMTIDELHDGFLSLAEKVYSADFTRKRRKQFMKRKMALKKNML